MSVLACIGYSKDISSAQEETLHVKGFFNKFYILQYNL